MSVRGHVGRAWDFLRRRRAAYQVKFPKTLWSQDPVLQDLATFCRANASTFHENPRIEARLDGRREVWLRIMHHLGIPAEMQFELYGGVDSRPPEGD